MKKTIEIDKKSIWLFLDNSPVHCSADVRSFLKINECTLIYLPQYTPELAPVELFFGRMKRLMINKRTNSAIDLDKESGKKILAEVIGSIDRVSIMKIWMHFISTIKQVIDELDSIYELDT